MAQQPRLQEFQPESEKISAYLERVELFFMAYDVAEGKRVPTLLSSIGAKTYALLRNLTAPKAPKEKSVKELSDLLLGHFEPTPIVIAERYRFHRREQLEGESITEYVAELRRLAAHCKFQDTTNFLEDSLRDRFVCGLRTDSIRKRLLTEEKLTFARAVELANSLETATKDAHQFRGGTDTQVNRIQSGSRNQKACFRCGKGNHKETESKFREASCFNCGKRGHIKSVCRSPRRELRKASPNEAHRGREKGQRRRTGGVRYVDQDESEDDNHGPSEEDFWIKVVEKPATKPLLVDLKINGKSVSMEIDTGAAVTLISETKLKEVLPEVEVQETAVVLRTYTSERIPLLGEAKVAVMYGEQRKELTLYITKGDGPCLMGREWLKTIRLDWKFIGLTAMDTDQSKIEALLKTHSEVFKEELGTMAGYQAKLTMKEGATPRFCRPRPVPFALKGPVERELARMERDGILKKVSHSEWATPIVPVPKRDGRVRVCGDYKQTVNPSLAVDQYPLPRPEDLFATLSGGKVFSKLDLLAAYQQVALDENSAHFLTITTHMGMYEFTRLPFGVASAPALFQQAMDMILQAIPGVIRYIDDILVAGSTVDEHLERLDEVLKRLKARGLRLRKDKCAFLQSSVEYLGHVVSAEGRHALPSKVEAIVEAPQPRNVQQLRSFLGMLNYYSKFIPNLASTLHPLNRLLQRDVKWKWSKECSEAFQSAKQALASSPVLVHYDSRQSLRMAADASAYGVGAVISHVDTDGNERPIAFASRTLSKSERNYAQIEKEALALVYGVRHFHQYLYGRPFTLVTDHQPLVTILGPKRGIPALAAARLQRWAITLSAYQYQIEFRNTREHANADGLSRLPLPNATEPKTSDADVFTVAQVDSLPVTADQIERATRRDPILSKVWRYTRNGGQWQTTESLKPFWNRRQELSVQGGCVMWGIRVVVPESLRGRVLQELHSSHQGVVRMKSVARSFVWWPNLDKSLEKLAKNCRDCQQVKSMPAVAPLHPWEWPLTPWERIHIDFAGPVKGKMFLVIVDAHSKWPEVVEMSSTTASKTIEVLRSLFAAYGLPRQVVSDNGPQFVADEYTEFLKKNGIKGIRSAPYIRRQMAWRKGSYRL